MAERRLTAQQAPVVGHDYAGFPSQNLPSGGAWFRTHRLRVPSPDRGAWYFSSSPSEAPAPESGRFDLPAPSGTCYLASTAQAAVRELTHPFYVKNGWVPAPLITGRVVSALGLRQAGIAADVSNADAASFRVSSELTAPAPRGELATPGSRRGHNLLPLMGGESALVASDAVLAVERTGLSWHAEVVQPSWETERRPSLPPPREIS